MKSSMKNKKSDLVTEKYLDKTLDKRFSEQDKKFEEKLDKRFSEQDKKFEEKLDKRFSEQDKKFEEKLDKRFSEFEIRNEKQFDEMKRDNKKQLEEFASTLLTSMESLIMDSRKAFSDTNSDIRTDIKVLQTKVAILEDKNR